MKRTGTHRPLKTVTPIEADQVEGALPARLERDTTMPGILAHQLEPLTVSDVNYYRIPATTISPDHARASIRGSGRGNGVIGVGGTPNYDSRTIFLSSCPTNEPS